MLKFRSDALVNAILFTTLSITWGFTWFCGRWQINNTILPEFAVCYRFLIASLCIFAFLLIKRGLNSFKISKEDFRLAFIYSGFSFSVNFILFYYAALHFVTGFSAVIFSFSIIFSYLIGNWFFDFKRSLGIKLYLSVILGIAGLVFVMFPSLASIHNLNSAIKGAILCFAATLSFSIGAVLYESKAKTLKPDIVLMFFWCLVIGSCWSFVFGTIHSLVDDKPIVLMPDFNINFIITILYLAIPSSTIGYLCFTALINRIGSVKASYSSLVSPVIAIIVSSFLEGYKIGVYTLIGIIFISCSKFVMFAK